MGGTTQPGIDHFWREASYNQINLSGSQVVGWYTLPKTRAEYLDSNGNANLGLLAQDCTGVADNSVYFPKYSTINLMFNDNMDGSAWGGFRPMTLDGQTITYGVTWMPPWGYANVGILGHEVGHSYGLPHSSGPYGQTYDSWWDVMSSGGLGGYSSIGRTDCFRDATYGCMAMHTISAHKDKLGWIPSGQKYTAASGSQQTVTIDRLGTATSISGNYLMARIPISGSTTQFYTVEARRPVGYDAHAAADGLVIHKIDTSQAVGLTRFTYVVDFDNNGNPNDTGATWVLGETFTNSANNISVQVTGSTASGYTVKIQNGGSTTPSNDNFANAQVLTGTTATGSNVGATKEAGEPNHAANAGGKSVWYRWTPQESGTTTIDTAGSDFDTLLAVYTGNAVNGLTEVASNDDENYDNNIRTSKTKPFSVTAGTTYWIAVDGYNPGGGEAYSGNIKLKVNNSDTVAPTGTIKINGGKAYTKSPSVNLSLSATDPSPGSGIASMRLGNDGGYCTAWQPYATSKSWTLRKVNGTRAVYVQYRDRAGNLSTAAVDTIKLDMVKPSVSGMSPKHQSIIRDTTPTIKATVKDNMTNLQKAHIKLYMDGKQISATKYSYSAATDVLTYNSPKLAKGKKVVKIVATDAAKNVGAKSWYFTVK